MITASLVKELREKTGAGMLDCKKALEATSGDMEKAIDWLREKGIAKAAKKADRIAAEGLAAILTKDNDAVLVEVNSETDFVAKNEEFTSMVKEILAALINSDAKTLEEALKVKTNDGTIEELIINKTAKIGEKLSLRRFVHLKKDADEEFGSYIHAGGKIAVLTVVKNASLEVAKDVAMHAAAMHPLYIRKEDVPADVLEKEKKIMREQVINEGKKPEMADKIVLGKIGKYYADVCLEDQVFIKALNKETVANYVASNGGKIIDMVRFEVGEGMEKREENFAEEVAKQMNNK